MSSAVSDYAPIRSSQIKIKKGRGDFVLKLKPTRDILAWAGKNKKHQVVVGFALEDKSVRTNAENKLNDKNLDMIIANTPSAIGSEITSVQVKTAERAWLKIDKSTKTVIAKKTIRQIESLCK